MRINPASCFLCGGGGCPVVRGAGGTGHLQPICIMIRHSPWLFKTAICSPPPGSKTQGHWPLALLPIACCLLPLLLLPIAYCMLPGCLLSLAA
jgi:hypothetical protein